MECEMGQEKPPEELQTGLLASYLEKGGGKIYWPNKGEYEPSIVVIGTGSVKKGLDMVAKVERRQCKALVISIINYVTD